MRKSCHEFSFLVLKCSKPIQLWTKTIILYIHEHACIPQMHLPETADTPKSEVLKGSAADVLHTSTSPYQSGRSPLHAPENFFCFFTANPTHLHTLGVGELWIITEVKECPCPRIPICILPVPEVHHE